MWKLSGVAVMILKAYLANTLVNVNDNNILDYPTEHESQTSWLLWEAID